MKTVSWNTDTHKYFQKVKVSRLAGPTVKATPTLNATPTVKATPTVNATPVTDRYAAEEPQNQPNVHI